MRILKSNSLLKLVNSYLIDASQPSNINYLWNFGSLLLVCLVVQIITGVTLAMHYSPNIYEAFNSIEHIRDVNNYFKSPCLKKVLPVNITLYSKQYSTISANKNLLAAVSGLEDTLITSKNDQLKLKPWFITGFVDAEGCFSISVIKDPRYKVGFRVETLFSISLHKKDLAILKLIQAFFGGVGNINFETKRDVVSYKIRSKSKLAKVLFAHFDLFPLITQKRADYLLFKEAFELISNKGHLTLEGLKEILAIKSNLNLGLPYKLRAAFPILPRKIRPIFTELKIPNPYWIAGFTSGEGSFYVRISESSSKVGSQVQLFFYLTQHVRDKYLLVKLISFFGAGRYHDMKGKGWASYECSKFSDITSKIIPFFNEYSIVGVKNQDFEAWCKIAKLMKGKSHLTAKGLAEIVEIKNGMNKGRVWDNLE